MEDGFSEEGYVYYPKNCLAQDKSCKVHIFLHGCLMSHENYLDHFVKNMGFLETAAANDIIVVFPQTSTKKSRKIFEVDYTQF